MAELGAGGRFEGCQLKVVSIDYFIPMKKRVWHALFVHCIVSKSGVGRMVNSAFVALIAITILSLQTMV